MYGKHHADLFALETSSNLIAPYATKPRHFCMKPQSVLEPVSQKSVSLIVRMPA